LAGLQNLFRRASAKALLPALTPKAGQIKTRGSSGFGLDFGLFGLAALAR
jgi:hypothetical protein